MSLSSAALLTVDQARTYAKLTSDDEPNDAWFEAAIEGVSAQIQSYTGRTYRPFDETFATTRQFIHDGGLILEIDDCREPDLVRVTRNAQDATTWDIVDTDRWIAEPLQSPVKNAIRFLSPPDWQPENVGWGALTMHLQGSRSTQWPNESLSQSRLRLFIEISAKWGWVTVPANIVLAAQLWIQYLIQRDVAYFSPELAEAVVAQGAMPPDVRGILETEKAKHANVSAV